MALASPCDSLMALKVAHALHDQGGLTNPTLKYLLQQVDPSNFPTPSRTQLEQLLARPHLTPSQFERWAQEKLWRINFEMPQCRADMSRSTLSLTDELTGHAEHGRSPYYRTRPVAQVATGSAALGVLTIAAVGVIFARLYQRQMRRRKRYMVCLPAAVFTTKTRGKGDVVNLSQTGCKIRISDFGAHSGEWLDLSTDVFDVAGKVIWCNAHYVGVQFRPALDRAELSQAINAGQRKRRRGHAGKAPR